MIHDGRRVFEVGFVTLGDLTLTADEIRPILIGAVCATCESCVITDGIPGQA
jgi:hypothetical protein